MNSSLVFITGMTGFVGQNLKPYLANAFEVRCISRKGKAGGLSYAQFLEEKIGYDAIIHLAGKAHDLKKTSQDTDYFEINFELTKRLFDQFLQSDAKRFIYISSVKAAADHIEGVLTEEVVPHPITAYGKSKLMAEEYLLAHLPPDKKVYILRPCMIHGPRNKGNLNLLFSLVRKGFPWILGAFENKRSFLSVENLCFVIQELLVQETIPSGVYNVADDEFLSTNDIIHLIASVNGKKSRIWNVPRKIITTVASIGDVIKLPINSELFRKLTESFIVSNVKIKTAIGKPLPLSAREGLIKTFQSFNS